MTELAASGVVSDAEVRAMLEMYATSAADSVADSSSRASGGAPPVLDAGNGVVQALAGRLIEAQQVADARALAAAMEGGRSEALAGRP